MYKKLSLKPLLVAIAATGALNITVMAAAQAGVTAPTTSAPTRGAINVGRVSAGLALNTLDKVPTKKEVFESTQSVKVIGKKQLAPALAVGCKGRKLMDPPILLNQRFIGYPGP